MASSLRSIKRKRMSAARSQREAKALVSQTRRKAFAGLLTCILVLGVTISVTYFYTHPARHEQRELRVGEMSSGKMLSPDFNNPELVHFVRTMDKSPESSNTDGEDFYRPEVDGECKDGYEFVPFMNRCLKEEG